MKADLDRIVYLPFHIFVKIHEEAARQLEKLYNDKDLSFTDALNQRDNPKLPQIQPLRSSAYGKNSSRSSMPCLQQVYNSCPSSRAFKEVFKLHNRSEQNLLYECRRFFTKSNREPMQFRSLRDPVLLILLLEPDLEIDEEGKFLTYLESSGYWEKSIAQMPSPAPAAKELDYSQFRYRYYVGLFFSILAFEIRYLLLSISEEEAGFDSNGQPYYAVVEKGLHDLGPIGRHSDQAIFRGKAYLSEDRNHYHATLHNPASNVPMNMQWSQNGEAATSCFRGTIQAISGMNGRMLCLETVFYEVSLEVYHELNNNKEKTFLHLLPSDDRENLLSIFQYVAFQRRIFASRVGYIPSRHGKSGKLDLKARQVHIEDFKFIAGTFRLLQLGLKERLLQSRLEIKEEGTGLLSIENEVNGHKQRLNLLCTLQPAQNPRPNKVIVVAYYRDSLAPCNIAILDFDASNKGIYEGVFSSVGFDQNGVFGEYFVFKRDNGQFEPAIVDKEEKESFLSQESNQSLLDNLLELHRKKHRYLPGWHRP